MAVRALPEASSFYARCRDGAGRCSQHIKARRRKEIPQVGHPADEARQRARLQPEFHLVVRIDEIQLPVPDGDAFPSQQPFKLLYRRPRPFDAHQLPDASRLLAACLQQGSVNRCRQQVHERQVRGYPAVAYLLVPAEGHLPGRKRHKDHAALLCVAWQSGHKRRLVLYVFYHVVANDQVKAVLQFLQPEYVCRYKFPFHLPLGKEPPCIGYPSRRYVHSCGAASPFGKGQQVAAIAAANLQHLHAFCHLDKLRQVGNKIFAAGLYEFLKVQCPVSLPFLHVCCFWLVYGPDTGSTPDSCMAYGPALDID